MIRLRIKNLEKLTQKELAETLGQTVLSAAEYPEELRHNCWMYEYVCQRIRKNKSYILEEFLKFLKIL